MMLKKSRLTVDEHKHASELFNEAYERINELMKIFRDSYGKTKEPHPSLEKAVDKLLRAKSKADDIFCRENSETIKSPYFGAHNR